MYMLFLNYSTLLSHSLLYINTDSLLHSGLLWKKNPPATAAYHISGWSICNNWIEKHQLCEARESRKLQIKRETKLRFFFQKAFRGFFMHCIFKVISERMYFASYSAYMQMGNSQSLSCWVLRLIRFSYMQILRSFGALSQTNFTWTFFF